MLLGFAGLILKIAGASNNKKVVRFLLPQKLYPDGDRLAKYDKRIDFDKHYFEISIEEFNKLLTMIK